MALHHHVGVPAPEDVIRLLNGLRRNIPILLALPNDSPFWQGLECGFAWGGHRDLPGLSTALTAAIVGRLR